MKGDELNANSVAHPVQPYMHSAPREKGQRPTDVGGIEARVTLPARRSVTDGRPLKGADEARGSS